MIRPYDIVGLGEAIFRTSGEGAEVVVIVPLYNYRRFLEECLDSVYEQTIEALSIAVIDDGSSDGGGALAAEWLERKAGRFCNAAVIRHKRNQGLSMARNSGIAWTCEPLLMMLDADNWLRRPAVERLREAIDVAGTSFAYSHLWQFGDIETIGYADIWDPTRLRHGNYIDAMALIRREALLAASGYAVLGEDYGWEDYDLWCRLQELGQAGVFLPEILCEYRVHGKSMLRETTNVNAEALMAVMLARHPGVFGEKEG